MQADLNMPSMYSPVKTRTSDTKPKISKTFSSSSFDTVQTWFGKVPRSKLSIFESDFDLHKEQIVQFIADIKSANERRHMMSYVRRAFFFPPIYILGWLSVIYFLFIGVPLWDGLAYNFWRYFSMNHTIRVATIVFTIWAGLQAYLPLLLADFEHEIDPVEQRDASHTALIIPAFQAGHIIGKTLEHALKIFRKDQIFVIANGNTPEPKDDCASVCASYGVNHFYVPIGSKIVAEFVGVALATKYDYVLLIDDDVHLPIDLPLVTNRLDDRTKCIGYTISSSDEKGEPGTYIQQCQDMEYKLSGLTRTFCAKYGSATFPHGAIILWERDALHGLFQLHPGFAISEDWYFGHIARSCGYRVGFCSQVFVKTHTPANLLFNSRSARGGYGETTVVQQRLYRWNFFFLYRVYDDLKYLIINWRLGFGELTTKFAVLIEIVDSVLAFFLPMILVLGFYYNWRLLLIYTSAILGMYMSAFVIFNLWHLRRRTQMVSWKILPAYFGMKLMLIWITFASVYYGLFSYVIYFSRKHPKIIENEEALAAAYNIKMGQNLKPVAETRSEIVEEVEAAQHEMNESRRSSRAEIMALESLDIARPPRSLQSAIVGKNATCKQVRLGVFAGGDRES